MIHNWANSWTNSFSSIVYLHSPPTYKSLSMFRSKRIEQPPSKAQRGLTKATTGMQLHGWRVHYLYWEGHARDGGCVHTKCEGLHWWGNIPFSAFGVRSSVVYDIISLLYDTRLFEFLHINPISLGCGTIWQLVAWPPGVALVLQYLQGWRSPPPILGLPSKSSTRIWFRRSVQPCSAWNYDDLNYSISKSNSWSLPDSLQWNIYFARSMRTNTMREMSGTHRHHIVRRESESTPA